MIDCNYFIGIDSIVWFCYPKKSSKAYSSDLSRDHGFYALGTVGFEPVSSVSIDENWTALRFRRVEFIKSLLRKGGALSDEGKMRIMSNTNAAGSELESTIVVSTKAVAKTMKKNEITKKRKSENKESHQADVDDEVGSVRATGTKRAKK